LAAVPVAAFALYMVGGVPWLPSVTNDPRVLAARRDAQQEAALIPVLRQRVAALDQHSEQARQGWMLVGGAQARQGDMAGAADAWRKAVAIRFDPTLAMETAEAISESSGSVTPEAAGLFRRALAEAPPDAPWRPMVEKRIAGAN
jgi:cytochrome c-type biogenesis protein CcmH